MARFLLPVQNWFISGLYRRSRSRTRQPAFFSSLVFNAGTVLLSGLDGQFESNLGILRVHGTLKRVKLGRDL